MRVFPHFSSLVRRIILQIARHWWTPDNPPFPSKRALAECIGVDPSTIRRRIQKLEETGILTRVPRTGAHGQRQSNVYRFDGLIKEATPFAEEKLQERAKRKKEDAATRRRKRARLAIVKEREAS